jgi:hypothetical protein
MRNLVLVLAWLFVLLVAGYDVYFAWQYREVFHVWEANPVARWIAEGYGLAAVFGLKTVLLGFAVAVAAYCHYRRHRLEVPYTLTVWAVHLGLSLHYLIGLLPKV